jgi:hypothetical protein
MKPAFACGFGAAGRAAVALVCLVLLGASVALGQEGFFGRFRGRTLIDGVNNTPYDGRFVFIRVRYGGKRLGNSAYGGVGGWWHDYPMADVNFMKILEEITLLRPRNDGANIFDLDDPELMQFPLAYLSEPGFWRPTDSEIKGLRDYLLKGGFLILDDFDGPYDWNNLVQVMRRVLPEHQFIRMHGAEAVWHSFFEIPRPADMIPPYNFQPPEFHGIFEDNDPNKRLMAVANYNNDIGDYWEWSGTGLWPIDLSNEAYKFGVNYVMYGLTH